MMTRRLSATGALLLLGACVDLLVLRSAGAELVTNRFGFAGKEIFPIDYQVSQLHAADLDGDGLKDLVLVNNARSKITLLYNQTGKTNQTEQAVSATKRELNELPPGSRFKIESIASEKRISSLVVADLNGDGRPDLAYFGEPKELVVLYNEGNHTWSNPKRWPLDDGLLNGNALATGDLNGDGRTDLLLLGETCIYWLKQDANHVLSEPEKIPYSGALQAIQVLDIQGDGRDDLLLVNWENPNPFRFRLQNAAGQLGPEVYFTLPPIRSYFADDLDGDHKTELVTIAQKSGRAQVSQFTRKPAEPLLGDWRQGQFQLLPLNKTGRAKRGVLWADLNGDGRTDLLVAEPDIGEITVYLQEPDGSFGQSKSFPSFTGVTDLTAAEWTGHGRPDVFVLSSDERQIGVSQFDPQGNLGFPKVLPFEGRPLAFTVGKVRTDQNELVAVIDADGRRELQIHNFSGKVSRQKLSESFKATPTSILIQDVNQDGLPDILILAPYEKIKVLLQVADKDFDEVDVLPPGGTVEQPWAGVADVDGDGKPELLLPQRNFVRAVVLQPEEHAPGATRTNWSFVVKEQINGTSSNSRVAGASVLRNATNRLDSLFLLDSERKALSLCDRNSAGSWQVMRNMALPVSDFQALQPIAIGGTNLNAIAFVGLNSVAWVPLRGDVWELTELDGYETPIKDGYLNDVVTGDLNQDGRKDLVFLETGKSYIDVVTFESPHRLVPANRWQVFEERSFRSRRVDSSEPREALIGDFTGDGKNDLVVLVHDRIILYPQE